MKGTRPKAWRQLLEEVAETGWQVDKTNAGHVKVTPPEGKPMFFGATLSEYRAIANNRAKLKRAGWPPKAPLTLPAQIVPPCAPTDAPTERETPMSNEADDATRYWPRPDETQAGAAIRFLKDHPNQEFGRPHLCEVVNVGERNLGELSHMAWKHWHHNRGEPGLYKTKTGRPTMYAWLTEDSTDLGVAPTINRRKPGPKPKDGETMTLTRVFEDGGRWIYRVPDGSLVRLVKVEYVVVDKDES